jgi:hypothetical protein
VRTICEFRKKAELVISSLIVLKENFDSDLLFIVHAKVDLGLAALAELLGDLDCGKLGWELE